MCWYTEVDQDQIKDDRGWPKLKSLTPWDQSHIVPLWDTMGKSWRSSTGEDKASGACQTWVMDKRWQESSPVEVCKSFHNNHPSTKRTKSIHQYKVHQGSWLLSKTFGHMLCLLCIILDHLQLCGLLATLLTYANLGGVRSVDEPLSLCNSIMTGMNKITHGDHWWPIPVYTPFTHNRVGTCRNKMECPLRQDCWYKYIFEITLRQLQE